MKMVDGDERQPACPGEGLCGRDSDEQGADQARAPSDGDPIDVAERGLRVVERAPHRGKQQLEMVPRRDLRHNAAVPRVQLGLGGDDVREDAALLGD